MINKSEQKLKAVGCSTVYFLAAYFIYIYIYNIAAFINICRFLNRLILMKAAILCKGINWTINKNIYIYIYIYIYMLVGFVVLVK